MSSSGALTRSFRDFKAEPDPYRCGCLVSSGVGGIEVTENETVRMYREAAVSHVQSIAVFGCRK